MFNGTGLHMKCQHNDSPSSQPQHAHREASMAEAVDRCGELAKSAPRLAD